MKLSLKHIFESVVSDTLSEEYGIIYVKDFLPGLRPNSSTYYNLDKKSIDRFKKLYLYLMRYKDKVVRLMGVSEAIRILNSKQTDYVKKYKAMEIISHQIDRDN